MNKNAKKEVNNISAPKPNVLKTKEEQTDVAEIKDAEIKKGISMNDYNKKQKHRNFWGVVNLTFFYLLLALFVGMIFFMIIGFKPAVVLTGSMEPAINPGDVTVYKSVAYEDLKVGDIIMFTGRDAGDESSEEIKNVTHRIVAVHLTDFALYGKPAPFFYTHGDANGEITEEDIEKGRGAIETVYRDQIVGKVFVVIPWIGIPLNAIRNNLFLFIFGALSLILIIYIISLIVKNKE